MVGQERSGDAAPRQKSYILRLWEIRGLLPNEPGRWRFSLEDVQNHERRGFADLWDMVSYLSAELRDLGGSA